MVRDGTGGWRLPFTRARRPRRMAQPTAEIRAARRSLRALRRRAPASPNASPPSARSSLRCGACASSAAAGASPCTSPMPGEVNLAAAHRARAGARGAGSTSRASPAGDRPMLFVPLRPAARRCRAQRIRHRRTRRAAHAGRSPLASRHDPRAARRLRPRRAIASAWAPATTIARCDRRRDPHAPLAPAAARRHSRSPARKSRAIEASPWDVRARPRRHRARNPCPAPRVGRATAGGRPDELLALQVRTRHLRRGRPRARDERARRRGTACATTRPATCCATTMRKGDHGFLLPLELRRAGHRRHRAASCARAIRKPLRSTRSSDYYDPGSDRASAALVQRRRASRAADRARDHARERAQTCARSAFARC